MPGKPVIDIYVRLVANHAMELFSDPEGAVPIEDAVPAAVLPKGTFKFHFIVNLNRGHHWPGISPSPFIETAELLIIPQTLTLAPGAKPRKVSPFRHKGGGAHAKDMNHFFPDPAPPVPTGADPDGWSRFVPPGSGVGELHTHPSGAKSILAGELEVIHSHVILETFKYAIAAVCDDGARFCIVDPTIKIEP